MNIELLDAEPLEVRNPQLAGQIDSAFEGNGDAFLSSLAKGAPAEEWSDIARYVKEEGERNMEEYNALCFLYACFILLLNNDDNF
jgi:hypothetical protein